MHFLLAIIAAKMGKKIFVDCNGLYSEYRKQSSMLVEINSLKRKEYAQLPKRAFLWEGEWGM